MKKLLFLVIPVLILSSINTAQAQYDYNWAVGFRVGEPLGFNLRKYFQNGDRAFDINIGTLVCCMATIVDIIMVNIKQLD